VIRGGILGLSDSELGLLSSFVNMITRLLIP